MIYVIAGTEPEAYEYINRKLEERIRSGEDVNSISEYKYVHNPEVFRGLQNPHGVLIGTWRERKDIEQIFQELMTRIEPKSQSYRLINQIWEDYRDSKL